ncbi:MAG: hypothetical protein RJA98_137 [Pseudomonadota bacterium]|jgi:hypothetical protein
MSAHSPDPHANDPRRDPRDATRTSDGHAGSAAATSADEALRNALRAAPPSASAQADIDALTARVMADWQHRQGASATSIHHLDTSGTATLGAHHAPWRRPAAAVALLLAATVAAAAFYLTRPDPVMDELMEPDVLSQMAAGEL